MHMLKDKYVDEALVKSKTEQSQIDIERLRRAVSRLKWANIPVGSDEELRKVSDSDVDDRINKAIADYRAEASRLMLSGELLEKALQNYAQCRGELKGHVATIHKLLEEYEGVHIKFSKDGRAFFNEAELKAYATNKATRTYGEVDKALYTKVGAVADALNDLLQFEKDNQLTHFLEREINDPYSAVIGIYDREKKTYTISRERYDGLVKVGFLKQHEMTPEEIKRAEHFLRHGTYE